MVGEAERLRDAALVEVARGQRLAEQAPLESVTLGTHEVLEIVGRVQTEGERR